MGDDLMVVDAARVSFNKKSSWVKERVPAPDAWLEPEGRYSHHIYLPPKLKEADTKLIHFLAKNGHWSPFAHPQLTFEVKAPMLVKNQWIKHRVGMSYLTDDDAEAWDNEGWNEQSMRYVSPEDFHQPEVWRSAPENKKQGSGADITDTMQKAILDSALALHIKFGVESYQAAIDKGVAPEQARLFLPMYAMYTSWVWTTSLYGIVRFLELRQKEDAQFEIRQYADAVAELVRPHFPTVFEAFGL